MKIQQIKSEDDLRTWLREQAPIIVDVELQWVEPNIHGSTVGAPDVILKRGMSKVDVELKYLSRTKFGTKFTLRPAQRRYHHMNSKRGAKTSLLAAERVNGKVQLFLLRGDHIPLRDYISDEDSGQSRDRRWILNEHNDITAISRLKQFLFRDLMYWWRDTNELSKTVNE